MKHILMGLMFLPCATYAMEAQRIAVKATLFFQASITPESSRTFSIDNKSEHIETYKVREWSSVKTFTAKFLLLQKEKDEVVIQYSVQGDNEPSPTLGGTASCFVDVTVTQKISLKKRCKQVWSCDDHMLISVDLYLTDKDC